MRTFIEIDVFKFIREPLVYEKYGKPRNGTSEFNEYAR